jgi:hypothetical protein
MRTFDLLLIIPTRGAPLPWQPTHVLASGPRRLVTQSATAATIGLRFAARSRKYRRSTSEGSKPGVASIGGRPRRDPSPGRKHRRSTSGGSEPGVASIGGRPRRDPSPGSQASEVDLGGIQARGRKHQRSTSEGAKPGSQASEVDLGGIRARSPRHKIGPVAGVAVLGLDALSSGSPRSLYSLETMWARPSAPSGMSKVSAASGP